MPKITHIALSLVTLIAVTGASLVADVSGIPAAQATVPAAAQPALSAASLDTASNAPVSVPGQYLVTLRQQASSSTRAHALSLAHTAITHALERATNNALRGTRELNSNTMLATLNTSLSTAEQHRFIEAATTNPSIATVEPNYILHAADYAYSHDPYAKKIWNIESKSGKAYGVNANVAWARGDTGKGTTIAVLDSGLINHPDLRHVVRGYDFVSATSATHTNGGYGLSNDGDGWDANPTDPGDYCTAPGVVGDEANSSWHGSHVAGIAAATKDNRIGVAGVAPDARIEPVRVLGSCGSGTAADIIAGITWASGGRVHNSSGAAVPLNQHPATVMNLSLGISGHACINAVQTAISHALKRGTTVVVAAGNSSAPLKTSMPANCTGVVDVTASTSNGGLALYSDFGRYSNNLVVGAPGGDINYWGDVTRPIYSTVDSSIGPLNTSPAAYKIGGEVGTSMGAPHVAGMVALIKQWHPSYSPKSVVKALRSALRPWSATSGCTPTFCGAGILDAARFVKAQKRFKKTHAPKIVGTAKVGHTVHAKVSAWSPKATLGYRWYISGKLVSTKSKLKLTAADAKRRLVLKVIGTRSGYAPSVRSTTARLIHSGTLRTQKPRIMGKLKAGQQLTTKAGRWPGQPFLRYRWYADGRLVRGASSKSLTLTPAFVGKRIKVVVIATKSGYLTAQRASATTAAVRPK